MSDHQQFRYVATLIFAAVSPSLARAAASPVSAATAADAPEAVEARARLAAEVRRLLIARRVPADKYLEAVVAAIATVPRHRLVPPELARIANSNLILPIGHGQTSTDPEYVAYMTALLRLHPSDRVFEVGTGSGYQAAVLGQIVADVRTVEIVAPLAASAASNLAALGYTNIHVRAGDGYVGWPEFAPYDAVIVTAGATCIPPALVTQLKVGGRLAIPLGQSVASEKLVVITKRADGSIRAKAYDDTMFVDFTGRIERSTPLLRFRRQGIDLRRPRICDA